MYAYIACVYHCNIVSLDRNTLFLLPTVTLVDEDLVLLTMNEDVELTVAVQV